MSDWKRVKRHALDPIVCWLPRSRLTYFQLGKTATSSPPHDDVSRCMQLYAAPSILLLRERLVQEDQLDGQPDSEEVSLSVLVHFFNVTITGHLLQTLNLTVHRVGSGLPARKTPWPHAPLSSTPLSQAPTRPYP